MNSKKQKRNRRKLREKDWQEQIDCSKSLRKDYNRREIN